MTESPVLLARYPHPVRAAIAGGEVVVVGPVDTRAPSRRRSMFRRGSSEPQSTAVEPGTANFVHADELGVVIAGTDVTLVDGRGTRRVAVELGLVDEISASRTMVAGAVSAGGRRAIGVVLRSTGEVLTVDIGDAELRSLAVSDSQVAWVDARDYRHVHLADPRDPAQRERLAVDEPDRVWFVGGDLYVLHRSGGSRVTRWSAGTPVTVARGISSLATLLGHREPLALLPGGTRTDVGGSSVMRPQRLVYLADPETVLYTGPPPDPAGPLLGQPSTVCVGADEASAVVVERHGPSDYRVLRVALPPAPRCKPAEPPPARPGPAQRHIMELELDPPYQDALEAAGLDRLGAVVQHTRAELLRLPGLDDEGVDQIEECLGDHELSLRGGR